MNLIKNSTPSHAVDCEMNFWYNTGCAFYQKKRKKSTTQQGKKKNKEKCENHSVFLQCGLCFDTNVAEKHHVCRNVDVWYFYVRIFVNGNIKGESGDYAFLKIILGTYLVEETV